MQPCREPVVSICREEEQQPISNICGQFIMKSIIYEQIESRNSKSSSLLNSISGMICAKVKLLCVYITWPASP